MRLVSVFGAVVLVAVSVAAGQTTKPAATKPAQVTTVDALVRSIPKDLQPAMSETGLAIATRDKWTKAHLSGQLVRVTFVVDAVSSVADGVVQITSQPLPVQHFGQSKKMAITVTVPAELADRFAKVKQGEKLTIVGRVASISVNGNPNSPDKLTVDNLVLQR